MAKTASLALPGIPDDWMGDTVLHKANLPLDLSALFAKQQVLDYIASGESPDYATITGGQKFSSFKDHPRVKVPLEGGDYSTAAGRYQFIADTWDAEAKKLGLRDFSPDSQDKAAWDLAQTTYKRQTGRDLTADAKTGQVDWEALSGQWVSLKGKGKGSVPTSTGKGRDAPAGAQLAEADTTPQAPADENKSKNALALLQMMREKGMRFTPVDYDPFAVAAKGQV